MTAKKELTDHPQSWGEAQDDMPDYADGKRPKNREVENENQRPANKEGQPPRPATEPKK